MPRQFTILDSRFSAVLAKHLGTIPLSTVPQSKGCKDLKIQLAISMLVSAHVGPKIKS